MPILTCSGRVDRRRGRRLGEAVPLQDGDADAAEEVPEAAAERGAAGDGVEDLAAHRGPQLAVDQLVEQAVLGPEAEAGPALVLGGRPGDGGLGRRGEDLALALGGGLLLRRVVDLLEHARHREDERRFEGGEVLQQVLDVGGVPHLRLGADAEHLDEPGEDVGQGQEEERGRALGGHDLLQPFDGVVRQRHEVVVGQLAALGSAGRARGVDDRGHRGPVDSLAAGVELGIADRRACLGQLVQAAALDLPHVLEPGKLVAHLVDDGCVGGRLEDDGDGAGVLQDPVHLLGRGGLVDRHRDTACGPDGEVGQRPLVTGLAHDRDPVARLDARGNQSLGEPAHLVMELARRDVDPPLACLAGEQHVRGVAGGVAGGQVGQASLRRGLDERGNDVVLHCVSFDAVRRLHAKLYPAVA